MSFVNPQVLWMMGIPLAIFTYFILTHKDKFLQVFDEKVLARLTVGDDSLPLVIRNLTLITALFFMVVAMARPVIDHGDKVVHLEGLSVVVALDISGSMRSKDVYPNRLEFAKKKINQLLDNMPNDDVSLIAFAYSSFMLAPFTSDKETLKLLVDGVNDQYINMGSTDFTALAEFTAELLEKKKPKILIVFSDGGEKEQLVKFEKLIKKNNIALYVVLVGTKEGAPVLRKNGKTIMKNGKMVISQRNDELGEIAVQNNGAFIVANSGESDIEELVSTIKAQHQSKDKGEVVIHDREELFYFPLGLGLLFLLLGFISLPRRG
jgi:Ca-activated chloride channel family protein